MDRRDADRAGDGSRRGQAASSLAGRCRRQRGWRRGAAASGAARLRDDGRHRDQELMHPILARLESLAVYLGAWSIVGVLIGVVLTRQGLTWPEALVQVLPPLLAYSFVCLSAWYVCRAMPLATSGVPGVLTASAVAATVGGVLWLALNEVWLGTLESMPAFETVTTRFRAQVPFLFAVSVMLFL